jgi:tRNA (guanine-N7-)-methyltransferase
MLPERAAAYERLVPLWSVAEAGPPLDLAALFGRPAGDVRCVLDVGIGMGEATVAMALARPDEDLLAVDVHTPGIGRVLEAVAQHGLINVRVVQADVLDFLPRIGPSSLAGVRIWFPDPWPKQRQRHKRIVRAGVLEGFVDRLAVGGVLHLATDVADYANQMLLVCAAEERIAGGIVQRPEWRPETRYEQRGRRAGRFPTDMRYERVR